MVSLNECGDGSSRVWILEPEDAGDNYICVSHRTELIDWMEVKYVQKYG